MTDMTAHLTRQAAFSRATFGPGARTKGVVDHVTKELKEVEKCYAPEFEPLKPAAPYATAYSDDAARHLAAAQEWADVAILGIDGLTRAVSAANPGWTFDRVAGCAVATIVAKQGKNELRDWPDWREADPDTAIEHVRGKHD